MGMWKSRALLSLSLVLLLLASLCSSAAISDKKKDLDLEGDDLLEGVVGDDKLLDDGGSDHRDDGSYGGDDDEDDNGSEGSYYDGDDENSHEHFLAEIDFFKEHDLDKDERMSLDEYIKAMHVVSKGALEQDLEENELPGKPNVSGVTLDHAELEKDFKDEDKNGDGGISLEEWLTSTFHNRPQDPEYDDEDELEPLSDEEIAELKANAEQEYGEMDTDKNGKVSLAEIEAYVRMMEAKESAEDPSLKPMSEEDISESVKDLYDELDLDKDGFVSLLEFMEQQYDIPPEVHQTPKPEAVASA
jgi:Ca2+-binding EF-hand superfamily protein